MAQAVAGCSCYCDIVDINNHNGNSNNLIFQISIKTHHIRFMSNYNTVGEQKKILIEAEWLESMRESIKCNEAFSISLPYIYS